MAPNKCSLYNNERDDLNYFNKQKLFDKSNKAFYATLQGTVSRCV